MKTLAKYFGHSTMIDKDSPPEAINMSNIQNMDETTIDNLEKFLQNWKMPSVPIKELYYIKYFNLVKSYEIKTVETTHLVTNTNQCFKMLFPQAIAKYLLK